MRIWSKNGVTTNESSEMVMVCKEGGVENDDDDENATNKRG